MASRMNRSPLFRKFSPRFWRDERIRQLTAEAKLVAAYVITAQSNRIGCFNFSPALAAEDLGVAPETFAERFEMVLTTLAWTFCAEHRVLYLPTWWRYNSPENPNVLKGNLRDLEQLPDCHVVSRFYSNIEHLDENVRQTFVRTLRERYPKRLANQEQKKEQKQEQESSSSLRSEELAGNKTARSRPVTTFEVPDEFINEVRGDGGASPLT